MASLSWESPAIPLFALTFTSSRVFSWSSNSAAMASVDPDFPILTVTLSEGSDDCLSILSGIEFILLTWTKLPDSITRQACYKHLLGDDSSS